MRQAKFYIYRNLHTGTFSVKHRGKVIAHPTSILALGADFRVSQKGRAKVLREKKKYVHAYVVADSYIDMSTEGEPYKPHSGYPVEVVYNPYAYRSFTNSITEAPQEERNCAYLTGGKVYVSDIESL